MKDHQKSCSSHARLPTPAIPDRNQQSETTPGPCVKWYLKREGLLDVTDSDALDYYLVLTGPASRALTSRGGTRPWCIEWVYLFDAKQLLAQLRARGVKTGVASSVRSEQWAAAEIFPKSTNPLLVVEPAQAALLGLFAPA